MEENLGMSIDFNISIEFLRKQRDGLIDEYLESIVGDFNIDKIKALRKLIDRYDEQIKTLFECVIIVELIKNNKFSFDI